MKKNIITHFYDVNPNVSNNLSTGYSLGCHWYNNTNGYEFIHVTDGIWKQFQTDDMTLIALAYTIAL